MSAATEAAALAAGTWLDMASPLFAGAVAFIFYSIRKTYDEANRRRGSRVVQHGNGVGEPPPHGPALEHTRSNSAKTSLISLCHGPLLPVYFLSMQATIKTQGKQFNVTAGDILVVAPYNAQVSALRRTLAPLGVTRVGTVDKFQGQEGAIAIYSMASSSRDDAPRDMDFLYSRNRLNVAVSRARAVAIVVASPRLLEANCRTPEQMRLVNALCQLVEHAAAGRATV